MEIKVNINQTRTAIYVRFSTAQQKTDRQVMLDHTPNTSTRNINSGKRQAGRFNHTLGVFQKDL